MDIIRRDFKSIVKTIYEEDPRYSVESYYFVRKALDYSLKHLKDKKILKKDRHISGQELLEGIRLFALDQYGPMAFFMLNNWNIKSCADFGSIVFNLVDSGVLGKTENDSHSDFSNGYDFKTAFETPFLPDKKTNINSPKLL